MPQDLQIDAQLLHELNRRADDLGEPLPQLVDRLLRCGLAARDKRNNSRTEEVGHFNQRTYHIGQAFFPIEKATSFAAELEGEEIIRKLAQGK